jgi:hypothetical protein
LIYAGAAEAPLPAGTPSLGVCWAVTIAFALVMFAAAWKISAARTTGDML